MASTTMILNAHETRNLFHQSVDRSFISGLFPVLSRISGMPQLYPTRPSRTDLQERRYGIGRDTSVGVSDDVLDVDVASGHGSGLDH
jgi:hypothetical protein